MPSFPPLSPSGLPSSPRAMRQMQMLSPLDTSFTSNEPYSGASEKDTPRTFVDTRQRNRDSLIFANATIPLSPTSSTTSSTIKESPFDGLEPRKRSGFARLFSCFGREERARRRVHRATEFEKVGESCHWTEY